jgi:Domain of Unknown Function with PDB structure (DUF3857)
MIKFKNFGLMLLLFLISKTTAQEFKLGNVTIAELEEKKCSIDTTAVASVLYNNAKTIFKYDSKMGFYAVSEYEFRIKINKKEGLGWANQKVKYRVGFEKLSDDSVKFSDAVTYNLEAGKIVKTKLNNEGSFNKNVNQYWDEAAITLPNVKVGSVIEFKYTFKSQNLIKLPVFNMQYDIPIKHIIYKTDIPEFYIYKVILTGILKIKSEEKYINGTQVYDNLFGYSSTIGYKQISSVYSAENVPALTNEPFIDNLKNYKSTILQEIERVRMPEEPVKDYSNTWEGVAKTIYEDNDFGKQLKKRNYIESSLNNIIKKDTTEVQRLNTIFDFVKNKMNWNKQYGIFADKGVEKAFDNNVGNTAEINFILIAMLNQAGFNANPVLVCTKENGIPVYPSRTVFNYLITAVDIDGKQFLLDPINKFSTPNIISTEAHNWTGRLIKKDGTSTEIDLVPKTASQKTIKLNLIIYENGKIDVKSLIQKTDYEALLFRENYANLNKESYIEKLENETQGIQIINYSNNCKSNSYTTPIIENIEFTADHQLDIIGTKIYLKPMFFYAKVKNPFVQEKRLFPISFGFPTESKYFINISIPDGYKIETMPTPINIAMPENIGSFKYNLAQNENNIQIAVTETINAAIVSADFYDILKDFFKQLVEKENEKIVLKKI